MRDSVKLAVKSKFLQCQRAGSGRNHHPRMAARALDAASGQSGDCTCPTTVPSCTRGGLHPGVQLARWCLGWCAGAWAGV
eukprot:CAMPEP_0204255600 /NCGR_PEP_ID=MMETSP0468-20130131/3312_1 /ASSEMBLY_ACC=CAM_ASM_000383 /TAXON_ID=2969 /ORGANISM="Oxyrrhis marina" /LENGTH=79 /DNA_ID=CAMNT_0051229493 /DNA_START=13 /DNA_END=249 /DNA_ORIENTATION=+